jgi:hypothetical protein
MMMALLLGRTARAASRRGRSSTPRFRTSRSASSPPARNPHWTTINSFRLDHREALAGLSLQVLQPCQRAGFETLGHVALDGSKVQANASLHKAMSHERMKKDEQRLTAEIDALMPRAAETDARENAEFGPNRRGDELPAELEHRESRLAREREREARDKEERDKEAAETRAAQLRENAAALREKANDRTVPPSEEKAAVTLAVKTDKQADKLAPRDDASGGPSGPTNLPMHRVQTRYVYPLGTPRCCPASRARLPKATRSRARSELSPTRTAASWSATARSSSRSTRRPRSPNTRSSSRTASRTIQPTRGSSRR